MHGTSKSYIVSIHSSFLPVFHYHTSNLLVGSRPSVGQKRRPRQKGGRLLGFKVSSSEPQGCPGEKNESTRDARGTSPRDCSWDA